VIRPTFKYNLFIAFYDLKELEKRFKENTRKICEDLEMIIGRLEVLIYES